MCVLHGAAQRNIIPRLIIQRNELWGLKNGLLRLTCGEVVSVEEGEELEEGEEGDVTTEGAGDNIDAASAQFGDSQQLRDFLAIGRAVEHICDKYDDAAPFLPVHAGLAQLLRQGLIDS